MFVGINYEVISLDQKRGKSIKPKRKHYFTNKTAVRRFENRFASLWLKNEKLFWISYKSC